jgi:hypothetical protein
VAPGVPSAKVLVNQPNPANRSSNSSVVIAATGFASAKRELDVLRRNRVAATKLRRPPAGGTDTRSLGRITLAMLGFRVPPYTDHLIKIPSVSTLYQPLRSTILLQVFAASVAQARAYDVDKPRNLAKSVTVE